jgi:hypothetical protein
MADNSPLDTRSTLGLYGFNSGKSGAVFPTIGH